MVAGAALYYISAAGEWFPLSARSRGQAHGKKIDMKMNVRCWSKPYTNISSRGFEQGPHYKSLRTGNAHLQEREEKLCSSDRIEKFESQRSKDQVSLVS